jgi:hypothetical protein
VLLEALLDVPDGVASDDSRVVIERFVKGLYTRVECVKDKMN